MSQPPAPAFANNNNNNNHTTGENNDNEAVVAIGGGVDAPYASFSAAIDEVARARNQTVLTRVRAIAERLRKTHSRRTLRILHRLQRDEVTENEFETEMVRLKQRVSSRLTMLTEYAFRAVAIIGQQRRSLRAVADAF